MHARDNALARRLVHFHQGAARVLDMTVRELLIDTHPHIPPLFALEGLTPTDAERRIAGAPHSIAEIVRHIAFWQAWFLRRCNGQAEPAAETAALGWPAVAPQSWPDISTDFRDGLERLVGFSEDRALDVPVAPALELPLLARYTLYDAIVHVAHHNAHHLGEIVVLRQISGLWPPASGSWTW